MAKPRLEGSGSDSDSLQDPLGASALRDPLQPVQLDVGGSGASDAGAVASRGLSSASAPLPHLDKIQASFGHHDVSGVKSQVGGAAQEASEALGANAFASGDRVGFSKAPDLHTAAHEAAHVVQQEKGVHLYGGVGRAGDVYERHADAVADRVVAGQSAESLLDAHPGPGGGVGVQREIKRSSVEKASLDLEGPALGVPGLKWSIKAEGEKEVESEVLGGSPETTVKASLAGGLKYDLWFLSLGVDLTGDIEIKVAGNETVQAALHRGVTEFARWYAASQLGDVAAQRANLQNAFTDCRGEVLSAYRELSSLLTTSSFEDFKTGATSWFYMSTSPRQQVSHAVDRFHVEIGNLFALAKASGNHIAAAKQIVDKNALLNDFAAAANTTPADATRNIDRSRGRFLNRFDPAKNQLLAAFDGLDAAQVLKRDPDVEFSGTFGAALSASYGWGEDDSESEVAVEVGAAKRIQSGDEERFELGSQDVLKGKMSLKLGSWGVEVKGERQATGTKNLKWKLELEGKHEGDLPEQAAEAALGKLQKALGIVQENASIAETSDVPAVLDLMRDATTSPLEETQVGGSAEHEVGLGGELELEYARPRTTAPWRRSKVAGKVSAGGYGALKGGLDFGKNARRLGKIEGGLQKGYKLSASWGG